MTFSLYVDAGYWVDGYTQDIAISYVDTSGVSTVQATVKVGATYTRLASSAALAVSTSKAAGNYVRIEGSLAIAASSTLAASRRLGTTAALDQATSSSRVTSDIFRVYPGVNLNAKSQTVAVATVRAVSSGIINQTSSTMAGSRIFWEMTTPATGTWSKITPQAEGSGQ